MTGRARFALLAALALAALWSPACAGEADAQAICWTTQADAYYHLNADCGYTLEAARYPLSVEAAEAFDKLPCPLCAADEAEATPELPAISATERGGTWVFRVPGALLDAAALSPDAGWTETAIVRLFCETLAELPEARIAVPEDGALCMNLRSIDGDGYFVVRPEARYSGEAPLRWRVELAGRDSFFYDDAEARVMSASEVMTAVPELDGGGYAQVFDSDYGEVDIAVYRAMGIDIAVLHRRGAADESALKGTVRIGDLAQEIPVAGYAAGGQSVFCCVITDTELGALVAGAVPAIVPREDVGGAAEGAFIEFQPAATLVPTIGPAADAEASDAGSDGRRAG